MNEASLLVCIQTAFPTEPLPPMTLRQAQLADQSLSKEISEQEWLAEGAKDRGITWADIPDEQLLECEDGLSHLDEESFVYYLPSFLRFAVLNVETGLLEPKSTLMHSIVFAVTHRSNYNLGRLKRLNEVQIAAVIDFLHYLVQHSDRHRQDAEKALKRYWLTPEAKRKTVVYVP